MTTRHSRESGNPGRKLFFKSRLKTWIPAFAGTALSLSSSALAANVEKVTFQTADGVTLKALYSAPAAGKPVVIMHHGFAAMKEEWTPLIDYLRQYNIGVLAYDSRPAGAPWPKLVDDVGAAVRFLDEKKRLNRRDMFLAGASLGANVCLKYAELTGVGRGVILLSPGINYQGLTIDNVVPKIKRDVRLLFIANPSDTYAYQSCLKLVPMAANAEFAMSGKAGHGAQMFDTDVFDLIYQWLKRNG